MDPNNAFMDNSLKNQKGRNISKEAEMLTKNLIIVHLKYRSSKVDMTLLESRTAFLGGKIL